jgi:hypothetical protein
MTVEFIDSPLKVMKALGYVCEPSALSAFSVYVPAFRYTSPPVCCTALNTEPNRDVVSADVAEADAVEQ